MNTTPTPTPITLTDEAELAADAGRAGAAHTRRQAMTPEEADRLYAQVQRLTLVQLLSLWRWICYEIAGRLQSS